MKTYTAKPADIKKKWWIIDAEGVVLGRLAAQVAMILRGKHKPMYSTNLDCGDHVVVINAGKIAITGKKPSDKTYYRHTGYPGGIKETTPEKILGGKFPERVIEKAVLRMMPKESPLAREQYAKLRVYAGAEHPHEAQQPAKLDIAARNPKNKRQAA